MNPRKVLILGAGGRDFHNFNVFFRDDPDFRVVAFTATQIPDIAAGATRPSSRKALSRRDPDPGERTSKKRSAQQRRRGRGRLFILPSLTRRR